MDIYEEIAALVKQNEPFAVATILKAKGSTPRHVGKMIVRRDGSISGTVGGGPAEAQVIRDALAAIADGQSRMAEYTLDEAAHGGLNMLCGGSLTVFIEAMGAKPLLLIVGAGHVGLALARLAQSLPFRIAVVDERPEYANRERYPMASQIETDPDITRALARVPVDSSACIVIATTDSDERCLAAVATSGAAYIGMIGSGRKVRMVLERLNSHGIPQSATGRVRAPVGLDIGAETPEEIAVSILAEILCVRAGRSGRPLRAVKLGDLPEPGASAVAKAGKEGKSE